ncbi:hypothetical protein IPP75_02220 [Candidatus Saccharibacteria bacterium]|nr:MAG: hypothetical protein IPP75_02220 [Candidatus Saccharibacteria bacterium]
MTQSHNDTPKPSWDTLRANPCYVGAHAIADKTDKERIPYHNQSDLQRMAHDVQVADAEASGATKPDAYTDEASRRLADVQRLCLQFNETKLPACVVCPYRTEA